MSSEPYELLTTPEPLRSLVLDDVQIHRALRERAIIKGELGLILSRLHTAEDSGDEYVRIVEVFRLRPFYARINKLYARLRELEASVLDSLQETTA